MYKSAGTNFSIIMGITTSLAVTFIGILASIILVALNVRARQSLIGSFFKKYYAWMIVATIIYGAGFVTQLLNTVYAGQGTWESIHHILLTVAAIIFVVTSIYLPKEASQYMADRQKTQ